MLPNAPVSQPNVVRGGRRNIPPHPQGGRRLHRALTIRNPREKGVMVSMNLAPIAR